MGVQASVGVEKDAGRGAQPKLRRRREGLASERARPQHSRGIADAGRDQRQGEDGLLAEALSMLHVTPSLCQLFKTKRHAPNSFTNALSNAAFLSIRVVHSFSFNAAGVRTAVNNVQKEMVLLKNEIGFLEHSVEDLQAEADV